LKNFSIWPRQHGTIRLQIHASVFTPTLGAYYTYALIKPIFKLLFWIFLETKILFFLIIANSVSHFSLLKCPHFLLPPIDKISTTRYNQIKMSSGDQSQIPERMF
jgi:hypothetical protein